MSKNPITGAEIDKAPINDSMKRALKMLRQSPVMFNALDLIPSECVYYIDTQKLEEYVLNTAESFLGKGEVRMVTIDAGRAGRAPQTYIWLKTDSRHLVDQSRANATDMVINPRVDRFSEDLKKFADQFAPTHYDDGTPINRKKRIRLIKNGNRDQSIMAMPVDLSRVLSRIFDTDNRAFLDTYGSDAPNRRCVIQCEGKFSKNGDRPILNAIKITKSFEGARMKNNRPRPAFRDRDDSED